MNETLSQSWQMTVRHVRVLARQPYYIAITLAQPIVWLVLFGGLFRRVVELPGFGSDSYLVFLVPGIVVMSSLFSNGWSGMGIIEDLDRGVMDRMLVSPVHRSALMTGRLVMQAITGIIQAVIIVALALAMGARFPGGPLGVVVLIAVSVLLGVSVASFSHAVALTVRQEESLIATSQMIVLPLTFLSTAFMARELAPEWIQKAFAVNPVNWAVDAGRSAMATDTDWAAVGVRTAGLTAVAVVMSIVATRAFRSYQASV